MQLNRLAADLCEKLLLTAAELRIKVTTQPKGVRLIDFGIEVPGGLEAGRLLAKISLSGLGQVDFATAKPQFGSELAVLVTTDHPRVACMASQYAGWEVSEGDFFAMGSGPMRALARREALFDILGYRETCDVAVGILESGQLPPAALCHTLARQCGVAPTALTLLVAPTRSQAGTVQVVARAVETAMHKLGELNFDLTRVESAWGLAPLPPVAADDLTGIGRTNDAILYGSRVTLYVRGSDESLLAVGPRVPSCASPDHGRPFREIFAQHNDDFYQIDRCLFSPAVVTLANLDTGHSYRFGRLVPDIVRQSFGTT